MLLFEKPVFPKAENIDPEILHIGLQIKGVRTEKCTEISFTEGWPDATPVSARL